jgi:hypothetical protein
MQVLSAVRSGTCLVVTDQAVLIGGSISLPDLVKYRFLVELLKLAFKVKVSHILDVGCIALSKFLCPLIPLLPPALFGIGFVKWTRG